VVQYAESQARAAGANLMGVVLNNLNFHSNGDSYYAYGYYSANGDRNSVDDCAHRASGSNVGRDYSSRRKFLTHHESHFEIGLIGDSF